MSKLPSAKKLSEKIKILGNGNSLVSNSVSYLLSKRNTLKTYPTLEDFSLAIDTINGNLLKGCEWHFVNIRSKIANELWSREIFIGVEVIDSLLYSSIVNTSTYDPIRSVLEFIKNHGLHQPGFLLYPLHSFGILGSGWLTALTKTTSHISFQKYGLCITPQTNNFNKTIDFLKESSTIFSISKSLPIDLLEHWMRSRPVNWLIRNPLITLKVQNIPGSYYENQFLLLSKLQLSATLIYMLSTLHVLTDTEKRTWYMSSSMVNNWQTFDIHHYMVFYNTPSSKSKLNGDCVPMNVRRPEMIEICDLDVDISPVLFRKKSLRANEIIETIAIFQNGYYRYGRNARNSNAPARLYRKLMNSLRYFRRSFHSYSLEEDAIVNLAVAFEVILTDYYSGNVSYLIEKQISKMFKGVKGKKRMISTINDLYKSRSEIVHNGSSNIAIDIKYAQYIYTKVFLILVKNIQCVSDKCDHPIDKIINSLHNK